MHNTTENILLESIGISFATKSTVQYCEAESFITSNVSEAGATICDSERDTCKSWASLCETG